MAKKNALETKLAGLDKKWDDAKENPVGVFTSWEDGKYPTQLIEAEIGESQNGRLQVVWGFQNLDSEEVDVHKMFDGLDPSVSEDCFAWLQNHIEALGFTYPDKISDLPKLLKKMVKADVQVMLQLKTKAGNNGGSFQNTYLNNLIEE